MTDRPNVMISSTARDLPEHRRQAIDACLRADAHPLPMEHLPADPADAVTVSLRMVDQADVYLGIFAYRYGYVPAGSEVSITELEYDRAVRRGIPRLVFFAHEDHPVRGSDVERGVGAEKLDRLKRRIGGELTVAHFRSPEELHGLVIHALTSLRRDHPTPRRGSPRPALPHPATRRADTAASVTCPYRGLFAFRETDAPFFFGREGATQEVLEAVRRKPLLAVIGPSGSGKSSLVFAGLLPRLRPDEKWLIASLRPGERPCASLAAALAPLLAPGLGETECLLEARKLAGMLGSELPLADVVGRILAKHPHGSRLLLVIDQAEELYAPGQDVGERERFLDLLLDVVAAQRRFPPAFTAILTLRADFLGHALGHRPLADALGHANLLLGPMSQQELRQAIESPASRCGVGIEEGLTERILADVGPGAGRLPLMQFALTLLWGRQRDGLLTHAAYDDVGGVERALADHATEVYEQFDPPTQQRVRHVFMQLVSPGVGTEDVRRLARRAEVGDDNWALVARLADARLVVTGRDRTSAEETVEIVHEALILRWGPLRQWLEEAREFRTWQERLRAALRQWLGRGRDEDSLLRGALLAEAEAWLERRADHVNPAEVDFVRVSRERQDQEERRWRQLYEETRRAESELRRLNETLEQQVRERTDELTRSLREAARLKDEFLATMAHELRNPLAPLRNGLQILRLAEGDAEATAHARGMMERQVTNMVRLVDDLLDLARVTQNKISLRKERLDVREVCVEAAEMDAPHRTQAGHRFSLSSPPAPLWCDGDRTRLAQVVGNLLNNAAKFTPPGGLIDLTVAAEGGEIVIRVKDSGVGIDASQLPRLFDFFMGVGSALERSQAGLGIGLPIARRLVELHGGTLEAHSDGPGKGSEFIVRLPLAAPAAQPPTPLRILVVDDNHDSADSLAMLLQLIGHEVRTANDGPSTLEAVEQARPDVVLCDVGMPGMNGFEVAGHLRQRHSREELALVAMSCWGAEADRQRSAEAGFDGLLVKPIEVAVLQELLLSFRTAGHGTPTKGGT